MSGPHLELTYDDAQLGGYSAPSLSGDTVFFTANALRAFSSTSLLATNSSELMGLSLRVRDGFALGGLQAVVFGDYVVTGPGATVAYLGMVFVDQLDPVATPFASAALSINRLTPLNIRDGQNHDWSAQAQLTGLGAAGNRIGLRLSTQLSAQVQPAGSGFELALIEQKFSGLQFTVLTVPEPSSLLLSAVALGLLLARSARRTGLCELCAAEWDVTAPG